MENSLKKVEFPNQPGVMGYSSLDLHQALNGDPTHYSRWTKRNFRNAPALEGSDWVPLARRATAKNEGKPAQDFVLSEDLAHRIALKHPGTEGDAVRAFFSAALASTKSAAALPASSVESILSAVHALVGTVKDMLSMQDRRLTALEGSAPAQALLPAPLPEATLSHRAQIGEVMAAWGHESGGRYAEGWRALYVKYKRVFSEDIKARAENQGKKPLDYAEEKGLLPKLLSVAKTHFTVTPGAKESQA